MISRNGCHEPSCWSIGNDQAAGSQFMLRYRRHHPDYDGKRPTAEMIRHDTGTTFVVKGTSSSRLIPGTI
jgi:hypothetical protein